MEDIALFPASVLRQQLRNKEISPIDIVDACLRRVEDHNPAINAIVTLNEHVRKQARHLTARNLSPEDMGPLYGLPVGIKDTTEVAGLRTTYGSPLFAEYVPRTDALIVQRLRSAGALILGKTNTPEFAVGGTTTNTIFGVTRNPWNLNRTPGGSTGGGAAALASGMIALAEGTDLGGSLRIPASFCGVVGLRPSPGLVPANPSLHVWNTLSVSGGMGRTAEDVALFLEASSGYASRSPLVQTRRFTRSIPQHPRIAYCADITHTGIEEDIEHICRHAALSLYKAPEVALNLSDGRKAFSILRAQHLGSIHYTRLRHLDKLGDNLATNLRFWLQITPLQLSEAEVIRTRLWQRCNHFFKNYDYLLTPCMAIAPFSVETQYPTTIAGRTIETYYDWFASTSVLSLTGLPVGCVPCGRDTSGLPVGLQIVGRFGDESGVLSVAQQVQKAFPVGMPPL